MLRLWKTIAGFRVISNYTCENCAQEHTQQRMIPYYAVKRNAFIFSNVLGRNWRCHCLLSTRQQISLVDSRPYMTINERQQKISRAKLHTVLCI